MKDIERITNDVYMIKHSRRQDWFVTVIVLVGKNNIGLVDTGFDTTPIEYIFPLVKELGHRINERSII